MKIYPSNPVCTNKNMYSALTDFYLQIRFLWSFSYNTYYGIFAAFSNCKALGADFVVVAECTSCDAALLLNKFVTGA